MPLGNIPLESLFISLLKGAMFVMTMHLRDEQQSWVFGFRPGKNFARPSLPMSNRLFCCCYWLLFWVSGTPGADNQVADWLLIVSTCEHGPATAISWCRLQESACHVWLIWIGPMQRGNFKLVFCKTMLLHYLEWSIWIINSGNKYRSGNTMCKKTMFLGIALYTWTLEYKSGW